jgi:hypothetical protein
MSASVSQPGGNVLVHYGAGALGQFRHARERRLRGDENGQHLTKAPAAARPIGCGTRVVGRIAGIDTAE